MLLKLLSAKHEGVGNLRHRRGMAARIEVSREGLLTPVECTASGLEVRVYSATKHTFPQECIQESMKCFIDQNKVCSVEHDQGTVQTLHCSIQHVSEQTLF